MSPKKSSFIDVFPKFSLVLPCIIHIVQRFFEIIAHDDSALQGHLEVRQGSAHQGQDLLHPVDLLAQEDVHGQHAAQLHQRLLHLVRNVVSEIGVKSRKN